MKQGFSLREYLSQQHGANLVEVDNRMKIAALWAQRNPNRSIRELVNRHA